MDYNIGDIVLVKIQTISGPRNAVAVIKNVSTEFLTTKYLIQFDSTLNNWEKLVTKASIQTLMKPRTKLIFER